MVRAWSAVERLSSRGTRNCGRRHADHSDGITVTCHVPNQPQAETAE
jgi:hypothetical protein